MKEPSQVSSPKRALFQSLALQGLVAFGAVLVFSSLLSPSATSKHAIPQSVLLQLTLLLCFPLGFASWLGLQKRPTFYFHPTSAGNLFWCLVMTFSALFLLDEMALWQERLTGVSASLDPDLLRLLRGDSAGSLIWIFLSLAVVPAACEEVLFRGFILSRFINTGHPGHALTMTALLFGIFHRSLATLLITSLAGFLLCFIVWRTGSLYNAMVAHATVNGWAILIANTRLAEWMPWLDNTSHVPLAIQALCATGLLMGGKKLRPHNRELNLKQN